MVSCHRPASINLNPIGLKLRVRFCGFLVPRTTRAEQLHQPPRVSVGKVLPNAFVSVLRREY